MAEVYDILCDTDGDLLVESNDMVIGDATLQHQADILSAMEGEYKQALITGVGIASFLNDEDKRAMLRKIRSQFAADKMLVQSVRYTNVLSIKASY